MTIEYSVLKDSTGCKHEDAVVIVIVIELQSERKRNRNTKKKSLLAPDRIGVTRPVIRFFKIQIEALDVVACI